MTDESRERRPPRVEREEARKDRQPVKPAHTRIILAVILAASAALGVVAVIQYMKSPFFSLPVMDEGSYVSWGMEIARGKVLGDKIFYQDPLYPYALGLLFSLFGESFMMVRIFQVLMGTAGVAVVFWIGRKLKGDREGLVAAGVFAAYRGLYFFELLLIKATMVIFLSALSCALGVWAADRPDKKARWLWVGLSLGLLTLLRGNFLALLPFMAVWAFFAVRSDPMLKRLTRAGLLIAGIMLVIVPVSVRNYVVAGELVLTTSQGGANFYIGNSEYANGRYIALPFVRPDPRWEAHDFKAEAERRAGHALTPSQVSGFWYGEAWKWMRDNPGDWARLLIHKARLLVHDYELPDNQSFRLTRDYFVPILKMAPLGFGWIWGLALIGTWVLATGDRRSWFPVLFAYLYAGSIIPFFIVDRYRVAMVPAMAVFAAAGLFWLLRKWRAREIRATAAAAAVLITTLFISFLPTNESSRPLPFAAFNIGRAYYTIHKPAEAIQWYDRALDILPGDTEIMANRAAAERMLDSTAPKK